MVLDSELWCSEKCSKALDNEPPNFGSIKIFNYHCAFLIFSVEISVKVFRGSKRILFLRSFKFGKTKQCSSDLSSTCHQFFLKINQEESKSSECDDFHLHIKLITSFLVETQVNTSFNLKCLKVQNPLKSMMISFNEQILTLLRLSENILKCVKAIIFVHSAPIFQFFHRFTHLEWSSSRTRLIISSEVVPILITQVKITSIPF